MLRASGSARGTSTAREGWGLAQIARHVIRRPFNPDRRILPAMSSNAPCTLVS